MDLRPPRMPALRVPLPGKPRYWPTTSDACGAPAGNPGADAIVVLKVAGWLGATFHLCQSCTDQDPRLAR